MKLRAVRWSFLELALRQGSSFVISVLLARLLSPSDFGLYALTTFFPAFGTAVFQGTAGVMLVQRQQSTREEETAVFAVVVLISCVMAIAMVVAGPWLAQFYGHPEISKLMRPAAVTLVLASLVTVPTALFTKKLDMRPLAFASVSSAIISGVVALILAWAGAGVWAIAVQPAVFTAINTPQIWARSEWRPQFPVRLRAARWMFRSGGFLTISSVLDILYTQGFALLVGKLYGAHDTGLFNRAQSTQQLPGSIIGAQVMRLSLPILSEAASDRTELLRVTRLINNFAMAANLPVMVGLVLLADLVVLVLFGEKWIESAPLLRYLALAGTLYPLHIVNLQLLIALGRPGHFLRLTIYKQSVGVACIVIGTLVAGIEGLAISQSVYTVIALAINARATNEVLGYGLLMQLRDLLKPTIAAGVMALAILAARSVIHYPPLLELMLCIVGGGTVYIVCIAAFYPQLGRLVLQRARQLRQVG